MRGSHLFQRVASFLREVKSLVDMRAINQFSSLSESGFIPTQLLNLLEGVFERLGSHLFQRVASFLPVEDNFEKEETEFLFSSLSESGFIPTMEMQYNRVKLFESGSHLFQRVASFLPFSSQCSTKEVVPQFSSLSESGFIPTFERLGLVWNPSVRVLISFREWLHSYPHGSSIDDLCMVDSSHLFQRVASFLHGSQRTAEEVVPLQFSSLSESGFIPTLIHGVFDRLGIVWFSSLSESGFIPTIG